MCEQLEDPKNTKGIVKRDVTEIISSGTIINSNSLDEKTNNYIIEEKNGITYTLLNYTTNLNGLDVNIKNDPYLINTYE